MVEWELRLMCVKPMQDKVNSIRGMAAEARDEFDAARADQTKAKTGSKALIRANLRNGNKQRNMVE